MPRLNPATWAEIRAKREASALLPALAAEYSVSKVAICRRAQREEWADGSDFSGVIRQHVNRKVDQIDTATTATTLAIIAAAWVVGLLGRRKPHPRCRS